MIATKKRPSYPTPVGKKRLTFDWPEEVVKSLKIAAVRHDTSASALALRWIQEGLKREEERRQ